MPSRRVTAFFFVSILAFTAALWLHGEPVSINWVQKAGAPSTFMTILVAYFEKSGWAWGWVQGWLVRRPDIRGKWQMTFTSDYVDPATKEKVVTTGTFAIKQTLSTVSIKMNGDKSTGTHVSAQVEEDADGEFKLCGVYRNEPRLAERSNMVMHYGAYLLRLPEASRRPTTMEGEYWNDRGRCGSITAVREEQAR